MTTAIPHRTLPVRPTSSECAMQAIALERGGKQEEVLVKSARDLIVFAAIYQAAGSGQHGVRKFMLEAVGTRYRQHAIATGSRPAELDADPIALAGHAATVLCRYLS